MPRKLKWTQHDDLAIVRNCQVSRQEFLDHMTFRTNDRPLFTEIFGPIVGLKEEWEEQGAAVYQQTADSGGSLRTGQAGPTLHQRLGTGNRIGGAVFRCVSVKAGNRGVG